MAGSEPFLTCLLLTYCYLPTIDTIDTIEISIRIQSFRQIPPRGDLRFDSIVPRSYRSLSNSKARTMYDF